MNLLIKYQKTLAEQVEPWGKQAVLIYRGQKDQEEELNSSAYRRLGEKSDPLTLIKYLTKVLIEPARSEGYAHQQNKELNDLELLAKLQHNGAATCLIDFTANFNIALWFACVDDKTDGKVFVVNRGDTQNFKEVTPERAKKSIAELLQPQTTTQQYAPSESQPEIYYWKPPANENRIVVQHSCFIFSAQPIESEIYKEITISKDDKQKIRTLLQKYYGLDNQSIFRDFSGFAASQGQNQPITSIDPTSEEQLLLSGNRHFQQGKYDEAIEDYDEAIHINPESAEAHHNRGTAKGQLGRHEEAIADFNEAIRINPQYAQAHNNKGTAKHALDRHDDAIVDYNEAIRINPQYAQAHNNRGTAKDKLDRHEEAIVDYNEAIRINPQYAQAHYNRGTAKDVLGRHEEAIVDYNKAIRINPQYAEAYYNRGNAKSRLGRHEEAIVDYNEAIRINPQYAEAYYNRGTARGKLGRYEDAIADFNEAIRINPQYAQAYCNRGNAKSGLGRHEEAIVDYNEAIRINPQDAQAYCNRGIANKEITAYERARADFRRAFELATEQGKQELAQDARRLLDELPPAAGED